MPLKRSTFNLMLTLDGPNRASLMLAGLAAFGRRVIFFGRMVSAEQSNGATYEGLIRAGRQFAADTHPVILIPNF